MRLYSDLSPVILPWGFFVFFWNYLFFFICHTGNPSHLTHDRVPWQAQRQATQLRGFGQEVAGKQSAGTGHGVGGLTGQGWRRNDMV